MAIATLTEFSQLRLSFLETDKGLPRHPWGRDEGETPIPCSFTGLMASSSFGYRIPGLLEIKIRVGVCFCMRDMASMVRFLRAM